MNSTAARLTRVTPSQACLLQHRRALGHLERWDTQCTAKPEHSFEPPSCPEPRKLPQGTHDQILLSTHGFGGSPPLRRRPPPPRPGTYVHKMSNSVSTNLRLLLGAVAGLLRCVGILARIASLLRLSRPVGARSSRLRCRLCRLPRGGPVAAALSRGRRRRRRRQAGRLAEVGRCTHSLRSRF
jgi:hypothetical protein